MLTLRRATPRPVIRCRGVARLRAPLRGCICSASHSPCFAAAAVPWASWHGTCYAHFACQCWFNSREIYLILSEICLLFARFFAILQLWFTSFAGSPEPFRAGVFPFRASSRVLGASIFRASPGGAFFVPLFWHGYCSYSAPGSSHYFSHF